MRNVSTLFSVNEMQIILAVTLLLAACAVEPVIPETTPGVDEPCGPRPLRPGLVVAFEQDRAIMPRENYIEWSRWLQDVDTWSACVEEGQQ